MIVSATSKQSAILTDIKTTLAQVKQGGKPNLKLVLDHTAEDSEYTPGCTVDFYIDADRTHLLFSENSINDADHFTLSAGRTLYTPPDEQLNFSPRVSDQYAQPLYYVTATFSDAVVKNQTYRNVDNLLFQSVIVSTKRNPDFSTNDNTCIIVPTGETVKAVPGSAVDDGDFGGRYDLSYALPTFELYLQVNVFDWENLSEENRVGQLTSINNMIRNAL